MKLSGLVGGVLLLFLCPSPSNAALITVSDLHDWTGQTNSSAITYEQFSDTAPASWTHTLTFPSMLTSFTSADIEVSFGGTRSSDQEVWLLWNAGSVQIGALSGSGNNSANTLMTQTFSVPVSLLPAFPTNSWSLALRLTGKDGSANDIFLDYSRLTATYEDGLTSSSAPLPMPEPATLSLLGLGLAGVVVRRRLKRK